MSSTDDTSAPGSTAPSSPDEPPHEPPGPAVGTLAWGLVALAVAGVLAVRELADIRVDLSYAVPAGMLALGVLLVVGAVAAALRQR